MRMVTGRVRDATNLYVRGRFLDENWAPRPQVVQVRKLRNVAWTAEGESDELRGRVSRELRRAIGDRTSEGGPA